jgi:hypothetical protein
LLYSEYEFVTPSAPLSIFAGILTALPAPLIVFDIVSHRSTPAHCDVAVLLLLLRVKSSARSDTIGAIHPITFAGLSIRYLFVSSPNQASPDNPGCDAFCTRGSLAKSLIDSFVIHIAFAHDLTESSTPVFIEPRVLLNFFANTFAAMSDSVPIIIMRLG